MRLFVPYDPAAELDLAAIEEAVDAASGPAGVLLYSVDGLSVRMRFLHRMPAAGAPEGERELPSEPALPELVSFWGQALEGVLWAAVAQIGRLSAQREWTRGPAGVEVTL